MCHFYKSSYLGLKNLVESYYCTKRGFMVYKQCQDVNPVQQQQGMFPKTETQLPKLFPAKVFLASFIWPGQTVFSLIVSWTQSRIGAGSLPIGSWSNPHFQKKKVYQYESRKTFSVAVGRENKPRYLVQLRKSFIQVPLLSGMLSALPRIGQFCQIGNASVLELALFTKCRVEKFY